MTINTVLLEASVILIADIAEVLKYIAIIEIYCKNLSTEPQLYSQIILIISLYNIHLFITWLPLE